MADHRKDTGGPTIFQHEIGSQSYYHCAQCSRGGSGGGGDYMPRRQAAQQAPQEPPWSGVNTWCNNLAART